MIVLASVRGSVGTLLLSRIQNRSVLDNRGNRVPIDQAGWDRAY